MKGQKQAFRKEELRSFGNERKHHGKSSESPSLDNLIEGVLEAESAESPIVDQDIRRESLPKRFRLPVLLSFAFLSAFFLGSLFGFFWGKNQENTRLSKEVLTREKEIFSLLEEIKAHYKPKDEPKAQKEECIEPILEQKEPAKLAFRSLI